MWKKIVIKDLKPNPFRNIKEYPIDRNKVQTLIKSIKSTSFWDNILVREGSGGYEIAYGHHRLVALKEVYKPTDEVQLQVRDLKDEEMLRIMAEENMEQYDMRPAIINETVKAVQKFLEGNPEVARKYAERLTPITTRLRIGHVIISRFLGGNWNESRVSLALRHLGMIESKEVSKEIIDNLPSQGAVERFVAAKKSIEKSSGRKVPESVQRKIVEKVKSKEKGTGDIHKEMVDEMFGGGEDKERKDIVDIDKELKDIEEGCYSLGRKIDSFRGVLEHVKDVKLSKGKVLYLAVAFMSLEVSMKKFMSLGKSHRKEILDARKK
jgi:hypothetical protein